MIKFCLFITILGIASAYSVGLMIDSQNEVRTGCELNRQSLFPIEYSSRYNCPKQYIKLYENNRAYCDDPSCPTGMQRFGIDSEFLYCCQEKCKTFDCDGAYVNDPKCKATHKAQTVDYGKTWDCLEMYYPSCPGGAVESCSEYDKKVNPNGTLPMFGKEFCCKSITCYLSGSESDRGIMVLDTEDWSWKCLSQARCSFGDFMMKYDEREKRWNCISQTCPQDKTKLDTRRNRYYCEADLDCISEFLYWNQKTKSWECPKISHGEDSTIESKLNELISKVNAMEQKTNVIDQKIDGLAKAIKK